MRTSEKVRSVLPLEMAGYESWVKPFLENPTLIDKTIDPSYTAALAMIAAKRAALRQIDIRGPLGRTAGWSPSRNFKQDAEFPYIAALLLKAAFGKDALSNKRKRHAILKLHPEFKIAP